MSQHKVKGYEHSDEDRRAHCEMDHRHGGAWKRRVDWNERNKPERIRDKRNKVGGWQDPSSCGNPCGARFAAERKGGYGKKAAEQREEVERRAFARNFHGDAMRSEGDGFRAERNTVVEGRRARRRKAERRPDETIRSKRHQRPHGQRRCDRKYSELPSQPLSPLPHPT